MKTKHPGLMAGFLLLAVAANAATWSTDLASVLPRAKGENKLVFINFTGSDWCPACIKMKNQVFASPAFNDYAPNVYLVEIDFPNNKPQSAAQKRTNKTLAEKYGVKAYPTMLLLNSDGVQVAKLEIYPDPADFIPHLKEAVEANSPVSLARKAKEGRSSEPLPLFGGAPTAPPPKYAELTLKSLSGPKNRRLALINNQTFASGESALVRLGEGQVKVKCVEIRDQSVVIAVDGQEERRELKLPATL